MARDGDGRNGMRWMKAAAGVLLVCSCAGPMNYASTATRTGVAYRAAKRRADEGFERLEKAGEVTGYERHRGLGSTVYRFTPTGPEGNPELADWGMSPLFATLRPADRGKDSTLAVGSWGSRFHFAEHPDPAATAWKAKVTAVVEGMKPAPKPVRKKAHRRHHRTNG
jgi:hypothetical protein